MVRVVSIAAGGAMGAVLRYAVSGLVQRHMGPAFPWGTLSVELHRLLPDRPAVGPVRRRRRVAEPPLRGPRRCPGRIHDLLQVRSRMPHVAQERRAETVARECAGEQCPRAAAGRLWSRGVRLHAQRTQVADASKLLRLSKDLPIVSEAVDTAEGACGVYPAPDERVGLHPLARARVQVIPHRHGMCGRRGRHRHGKREQRGGTRYGVAATGCLSCIHIERK